MDLATSLSTEKMSISLRSKVSAHRWESLAALISCTFTCTASPLFCTPPSRMGATPSCLAISATFPEHFCNVASTCARLPLDPRFWTSASEFHPEYHQQSRRWLYLRSGFQTEAQRCFFPK